MIGRIWRCSTTHDNADAFEHFMRSQHYPTILGKPIAGFCGSQLLRLTRTGQTEFKNIMWFDSVDAVRALARGEPEKLLFLPPTAQALLRRFDARAEHFEVREIKEP